eukprot:m51a1_g4005 putative serine threonine kinase (748) ;mRNA; r:538573-544251
MGLRMMLALTIGASAVLPRAAWGAVPWTCTAVEVRQNFDYDGGTYIDGNVSRAEGGVIEFKWTAIDGGAWGTTVMCGATTSLTYDLFVGPTAQTMSLVAKVQGTSYTTTLSNSGYLWNVIPNNGARHAFALVGSLVYPPRNLTEVAIMRSLRHPNVLLFMCYAKSDADLIIVTEFMPNGSMMDIISDSSRPLPLKTRLSMLLDICRGMSYLHFHEPQIIHCDLKSSNVLVDSSLNAKVCDFGLTVLLDKGKTSSATSKSRDSAIGSLFWTAPEVIAGAPCTTKSDVFSFGVIIWEAVTRETPYSEMNPHFVAQKVLESQLRPSVSLNFPRPLQSLMEHVRPEFPEIVSDWSAMLGQLEGILKAEETQKVYVEPPSGLLALVFTAAPSAYIDLFVAFEDGVTLFRGIRVRMGIHVGVPEVEMGEKGAVDYLGPCVNKAARVSSLAFGGQIIVSSTARLELDKVIGDVREMGEFRELGPVVLKGIPGEEIRFTKQDKPKWAVSPSEVTISNEQIGRGNFGAVFKGQWKGQTVVVKQFFQQKVDKITLSELERQLKEISILTELRHRQFITEWMDMGSLREVLSAQKIEYTAAVPLLTSVCQGMTYLHMSNIVHRDLKSSNILLNKKWDVKLSDFGLAAIKSTSKTMTVCGTVSWMAPEVLASSEYSEKSDVYGYAMVMYEVLTRHYPFMGVPVMALVPKIVSGQRPLVPQDLAGFSPEYVALMVQCWSPKPAERPAFNDISAALAGMSP